MLSTYFGKTRVHQLFIFCYVVLALGLPLNKIVLSLGTMLVFLLFLLDFKKRNFYRIRTNKHLRFVLFFLLIHLLSFFWSDNSAYFLKDFVAKLPLYALPLAMVTHPVLKPNQQKLIFNAFILSVFVTTLINFILFYSHTSISADPRSMSLFISHIRLGLMLIFAFFLCLYLILYTRTKYTWLYSLLILWFLVYIYFSGVLSTLVILLVLLIFGLTLLLFRTYARVKASLIVGLIYSGILLGCFLFYHFFFKPPPLPQLSAKTYYTAEGNPYTHDFESRYFINDQHVYSFICQEELEREWKKRTPIEIHAKNKFGYAHYYTLIQYMTAKGLKKDALGFKKLSPQDFRAVLEGQATNQTKTRGLYRRMESLRNEFYDNDPNGKTLKQRFEYVKTGWRIFKDNLLIGVGSGDLADAFERQYKLDNSLLTIENRLRAHNQVLTYFISFGLIGGLLFVTWFFSSLRIFIRQKKWLSALFVLLILLSFLSEDTLETQMGVTFFAFFYGFFISSPLPFKPKYEA